MTSTRRLATALAVTAVPVIALAGCATSADPAADTEGIQVVASTSVYASIAEAIGGDLIDVTAIIDSDAQDPHSYEATAQDQLKIAKADLVIENGGGYDAFVDTLLEASGSEADVITAVEYSHDYPGNEGHSDEDAATDDADHAEDDHAEDDHDHAGHDHIEGFNEHVWYDPHTIAHLAEAIAEELGELSPDDAATFTANAETFSAEIEGLEASLADIDAAHHGEQVFVTEPVAVYLLAAAGLENATPDAFSEAVEEGNDVAPATLLESLHLIEGGEISVVIENTQTGGAETEQITDAATDAGIPVIAFSETLPAGQTYISWMQANIEALSGALVE